MTTQAEAIATAEAERAAAIDLAQQAFRAAIEEPAAAYIAATAGARAELDAAEALANQEYADAIDAARTIAYVDLPLAPGPRVSDSVEHVE